MTVVASKELKNHLGKYLRLVRNGDPVQITDRGNPIACILPVRSPAQKERVELLSRLVAKGNIRLGSGRLRKRKPAVLKPGKSIAEMIAENRR